MELNNPGLRIRKERKGFFEMNKNKEVKSQVLDNPDNCGLWLNVNIWGHVIYFEIIEDDNKFYARTVEGTIPCEDIGGQWIHVILESKETKLIDKDTLKCLDNLLDRDRRAHSSDFHAGWDRAFEVIYNWMKGVKL